MLHKKAVVVHSGGMDSSLCLALAVHQWGKESVVSLSFDYGQRHGQAELAQAAKICRDWQVDHTVLSLDYLPQITQNALTNHQLTIQKSPVAGTLNTLVVGRNGLMAQLAGIYAHQLQANRVYLGIMERENSGYRDCSRHYMDLMQTVLRLDLDQPAFAIETPLVAMTKKDSLETALQLGLLEYLLINTISCYQGVGELGCQNCPACELRNQGIAAFLADNPDFRMPYLFDYSLVNY